MTYTLLSLIEKVLFSVCVCVYDMKVEENYWWRETHKRNGEKLKGKQV